MYYVGIFRTQKGVPVAIAGGRASEPAAIRGDAGPDRTATDADGIERSGCSSRSYQMLDKEECCKNRAQNGAIPAVPMRMADRRECSDEESFHNVGIGEMGIQWRRSRSKRKFRINPGY